MTRVAFNKENPADLLSQLVKVLRKAGLDDDASRVKSMSKDVQRSWQSRGKVASLTDELRTMTKSAFESAKRYRVFSKEIFSEYKGLGTESIERVRAMHDAATALGDALSEMDRYLMNMDSAVGSALRPQNVARDLIRGSGGVLTKKDQDELMEFAKAEGKKRLAERVKMLQAEAKRYGL